MVNPEQDTSQPVDVESAQDVEQQPGEMSKDQPAMTWHVIGESVLGATHKRSGLPNQDAISGLPDPQTQPPSADVELPLILAVADGHGSAKSFRSDRGSWFAVQVATEQLHQLLSQIDSTDLRVIQHIATEQLPQLVVRAWHKRVEENRAQEPYTDDEWQRLLEKDGQRAQQAVEANPSLAYGATLLAVAVTETFVLYLQLGDGDILSVDVHGETQRPFPKDERLIANETTSLCLPKAWQEFRVRLVPTSAHSPMLILVSTDGYANSFRTEADFIRIGRDYLQMMRTEGPDHVKQQLAQILADTSESGSGDDITLGLIRRTEGSDPVTRKDLAVVKTEVDQIKSEIAELRNQSEQKAQQADLEQERQARSQAVDALEAQCIIGIQSLSDNFQTHSGQLDAQGEQLARIQNTVASLKETRTSMATEVQNVQRSIFILGLLSSLAFAGVLVLTFILLLAPSR